MSNMQSNNQFYKRIFVGIWNYKPEIAEGKKMFKDEKSKQTQINKK